MHMLFAKSGLRKEEMLILKKDDLILNDWKIMAPLTGKRLEFRSIFLDDELMLSMLDHLDWRDEYATCDNLFISPTHGGQLYKDYPNNFLRKVGKELNMHDPNGPLDKRLTTHSWRWTFTTWMHRAGMNDQYIKYLRGDVLGNRQTWEGYLEIDPDLVRLDWLQRVPKLL